MKKTVKYSETSNKKMKLFELQIIENIEKLGRRHSSMNPINHLAEYDAMVNAIHFVRIFFENFRLI